MEKIMKKYFAQFGLKKKKEAGFTLVELLISMSIFTVFLTIATNSYISIVRAQRETNTTRQMYSDLRNFINLVEDEMRDGSIDYLCYSNFEQLQFGDSGVDWEGNPLLTSYNTDGDFENKVRCASEVGLKVSDHNNLKIISRDGLRSTILKFADGKIQMKRLKKEGQSWNDVDSQGFQGVLFSNVKVTRADFYIFPALDPVKNFDLMYQFQPHVTMVLQVESHDGKQNISYQTTLSARDYH